MLKRRASKRFVLVESGEEPQVSAGGDNATGSSSVSASGSGGTGPVIPHFVAVDCGQNDAHSSHNNNNNVEMTASITNHNSSTTTTTNNNNNNNNNQSSASLLGVPVVGTLK